MDLPLGSFTSLVCTGVVNPDQQRSDAKQANHGSSSTHCGERHQCILNVDISAEPRISASAGYTTLFETQPKRKQERQSSI
jgi:hypothetical protein